MAVTEDADALPALTDPGRGPVGAEEFAALMAPLGPWPVGGCDAPIAVAASGGADSTALALLVREWAVARGLRVLALVVDHGLRAESAAEALQTVHRLGGRGMEARLITLRDLAPGTGMAERARAARYRALTEACREAGAVDLLLGHHADDQAETVLMRRRARSGPDGLAGMALLTETTHLRLLRPLLPVEASRLRATVQAAGLGWVEDASNRDPRAGRARLRMELAASGDSASLLAEAHEAGESRTGRASAEAAELAARACLHPEGFAHLPLDLLSPPAMASLIRTVGGAPFRASMAAVARLVARPAAATLGGVRLVQAGRFGPGWLLCREAAALSGEVPAAASMLWDGRFVLHVRPDAADLLAGGRLGALGDPSCEGGLSLPSRPSRLPDIVLRTLPAVRRDRRLLAVPHLGWLAEGSGLRPGMLRVAFQPAAPATGAPVFALKPEQRARMAVGCTSARLS